MPVYDYNCMSCGHRFEARQGFNDDPVASCPTCGKRSERLITAVAVHFRGTGFYKTDYKSAAGHSSSNGKGPDSRANGKVETGPSTKAPADSANGSTGESGASKPGKTATKPDK